MAHLPRDSGASDTAHPSQRETTFRLLLSFVRMLTSLLSRAGFYLFACEDFSLNQHPIAWLENYQTSKSLRMLNSAAVERILSQVGLMKFLFWKCWKPNSSLTVWYKPAPYVNIVTSPAFKVWGQQTRSAGPNCWALGLDDCVLSLGIQHPLHIYPNYVNILTSPREKGLVWVGGK